MSVSGEVVCGADGVKVGFEGAPLDVGVELRITVNMRKQPFVIVKLRRRFRIRHPPEIIAEGNQHNM